MQHMARSKWPPKAVGDPPKKAKGKHPAGVPEKHFGADTLQPGGGHAALWPVKPSFSKGVMASMKAMWEKSATF